MKKLTYVLFASVLLSACSTLPESEDPPIVEGLPTMAEIADSLNASAAQAIKWSLQHESGEVRYAASDSIDWTAEFQAFLKDNVNLLRYEEAYDLTDSTSGDERYVRFTATGKKQEVRRVEIDLRSGKLTRYLIEKNRNNLFSSSKQQFLYDGSHFELAIDQKIEGVFQNKQFLYGDILPKGRVYQGLLDLTDDQLPFILIIQDSLLLVKNGAELMSFHRSSNAQDSVVYHSDFFNSRFVLNTATGPELKGRWVNAKRDESRSYDFRANANHPYRFPIFKSTEHRIAGKHLIVFEDPKTPDKDSALLVLKQTQHLLEGSILTSTGDYRFLEGGISGDSVFLSTMDGTHSYLFKGVITKDQRLQGVFKAGKTWRQYWTAYLDQPFDLGDPESLTAVRPDESFHFEFMNPEGDVVSLSDPVFANKPVLVSVMGTWCSNCLDEIRFLRDIRKKYTEDELAIVALDFELISDTSIALANINRYRQNLAINFPILLASLNTTKQKASEALPSLSSISSYPTLVVLNRAHEVERIHTGFSGPATGSSYFENFRKEYLELVDQLVSP